VITKKRVNRGDAVDEYKYVPEGLRKFCVPIESVKMYDKNPRRNDIAVDDLAASIKVLLFRKPIVIDQHNVIRAGNTAYKAARKLGMRQIPVAQSEFTDESTAVEFVIADNRLGENSDWDLDILKDLMSTHQLLDEDKRAATGFTQTELDTLFDIRKETEKVLRHAIEVAVTCDSESAARTLYERLTSEGYACRVLTL
jgi:ParB-like chromosome segregation protein Spo0J